MFRKNLQYAKNMMIGIYDQYELWIRLCYTQEGPEEYAAFLEKERVEFENFEGISSYETMRRRLGAVSFGRLPSKRNSEADPDKKRSLKREERILKIC